MVLLERRCDLGQLFAPLAKYRVPAFKQQTIEVVPSLQLLHRDLLLQVILCLRSRGVVEEMNHPVAVLRQIAELRELGRRKGALQHLVELVRSLIECDRLKIATLEFLQVGVLAFCNDQRPVFRQQPRLQE